MSAAPSLESVESLLPAPDATDAGEHPNEHSDVFVCRHEEVAPASVDAQVSATVTLFVYGWHNVEPGPLSWVFPSLRAALDAVRTMRNAIKWCIVSGESWETMDDARDGGAVLIEELGGS